MDQQQVKSVQLIARAKAEAMAERRAIIKMASTPEEKERRFRELLDMITGSGMTITAKDARQAFNLEYDRMDREILMEIETSINEEFDAVLRSVEQEQTEHLKVLQTLREGREAALEMVVNHTGHDLTGFTEKLRDSSIHFYAGLVAVAQEQHLLKLALYFRLCLVGDETSTKLAQHYEVKLD